MINIKVTTKYKLPIAIEVSGHALFDDYGKDIVCAGVASSFMMCINGITEILKETADVLVEENKVSIALSAIPSMTAVQFLETFWLHARNLKEDYPNNIKITASEV